MRKTRVVLLALAAALACALALPTPARADAVRLAGGDRYATMAAIVDEGFGESEWVVVATGQNFPDALAASALAGARHCPVVLTRGDELSQQARSEVARLGARHAYVMGGEAAVSSVVVAELGAMGVSAERVAGADRVGTSVAALSAARAAGAACSTVVVATSGSFADALSVGPWCWLSGSPVVLAEPGKELSEDALAAVRSCGATRAVVVGGTSAVSAAVESQLAGLEVVRLAGPDRYATSAEVAAWCAGQGLSWAEPCVATGQNFPDALAGAALAGSKASPLLLAHATSDPALALLDKSRAPASRVWVLGGPAAVPDEVAAVAGDHNAYLRAAAQARGLTVFEGTMRIMDGLELAVMEDAGFAEWVTADSSAAVLMLGAEQGVRLRSWPAWSAGADDYFTIAADHVVLGTYEPQYSFSVDEVARWRPHEGRRICVAGDPWYPSGLQLGVTANLTDAELLYAL